MKFLVLVVSLISAVSISARTFTSANNSKTIEAELIDYLPSSDKIVIRNEGSNRNVTVNASAFSAEDRAYFNEFLKEKTKRNSLKVSAKDKSEDFEREQGSLYVYDQAKKSFNVKVSNSGSVAIEGLTAKYEIYVSRYDKEGDKVMDVVSGDSSIGKVWGGSSQEFESVSVEVTNGCVTTSSCPKCKTKAASVERERVLGIYVRLFDDSGVLLTEFYSSKSLKSVVKKKSRES